MKKNEIVKFKAIQRKIFAVRGLQVMVDSDLAEFYGVETKRLNEQVKRNIERFPEEFMFQLTKYEFDEWMSQIATSGDSLRSQFATLKDARGKHRKHLPYVFTEQGVAMLAEKMVCCYKVKINAVEMLSKVRKGGIDECKINN